jgi:hypothetical protein
MSKNQKNFDALNTGFEKIVLLNELHEDIESPPVIKTPLGNYLVCYTKLDTVLLTPEIFGSWSRLHGATGFAALDEPVEEVNDVHFCLRFASEINLVGSGAIQAGPPEGAILPVTDEEGNAAPEIRIPSEGEDTSLPAGVVPTPDEFVCMHNRTVADAYICMGTTGPLGLENPEKPVLPPVIQQYHKMVGEGRVSCDNLLHLHVSDRRNVFYETGPGPDTGVENSVYRIHLSAVEYPQQPKDPCMLKGIPLPSWHSRDSKLFDDRERNMLNSRWDEEYVEGRLAVVNGKEALSGYFTKYGKYTDSLPYRLLGGAKGLTPGRIENTAWRNVCREDPVGLYDRHPPGYPKRGP